MSDDQFTRLFKYMEEFRADFNHHMEESRREHADIRAAIGELSAQVKDYHEETMVIKHQLDQMREAIKQIAAETGVKLKFEL
jgi:uncharacterized coiled-coil DUF342 family protein